ncbi:MAG: phosphomannomutase/phosphoglucomutase [Spirochaetales bacterium]|nr:phosphomannomutase/phosphoglucomutase [Spirochaetales bacterium]
MIDFNNKDFRNMFREYDLRGRVNEKELNPESVFKIARAFGALLKKRNINDVVVGYDNRKTSLEFKNSAVTALLSAGFNVIDIGLTLSPVLYFAQHFYNIKGGLMITASHNPDEWSGMKLSHGLSKTLGPREMKELFSLVVEDSKDFRTGKYEQRNIRPAYIDRITKGVRLEKPLKTVVECGNGGAGVFAYEVLQKIGAMTFQLYCDPDTRYPNYFPNPSSLKARKRLREIVTHPYINADIGIGIDGDGDRLGVQDNLGNNVWSDKVLLFLARDMLEKKPGSQIVFDVKCTQALIEDIKSRGGNPFMWKTGHSYIKAKLHELNAELGGERSGHIFFNEGYYGFDDALFAAVKFLEYLSKQDKKLSDMLLTIPQYITSPEIQAHCEDSVKYKVVDSIIEDFKKDYGDRVIDINGARVMFDDGWGLVRASSNLPELVIIFEAKTEKRLLEIRDIFRKKINSHPEVDPAWENDIYA